MFLAKKKEEGHHPLINLKYLNIYRHFKRDGIHLTKDLLQRNEFLIKKGLKKMLVFLYIQTNNQEDICGFDWRRTYADFFFFLSGFFKETAGEGGGHF